MTTASFAGTSEGDASTRIYLTAAVERVFLAAQLADVGREQRDPLPLIAAARLLAWASPSPEALSPELVGGEPDRSGVRIGRPYGPPVTEHTPLALLMAARALAGNDQQLLGVIDASRLKNEEMIKLTGNGGPSAYKLQLRRGAKATFRIDFRGRENARAAIVGTTGADLDLIVLDQKNAVVCESRGWADNELCKWEPAANATFSIVVENRGEWANEFTIYTN